MEPARLPHIQQIHHRHVDRLVLETCDVQEGIDRVALRARPQGSTRVTMYQLAEIAGCDPAQDAIVLDQIRTVGRDDVRNLDVHVVDRGAESRQESRCQHDTHVRSLAVLWLEYRVATENA